MGCSLSGVVSFIPMDVKTMKDGAAGLNKYLVNNSAFVKGKKKNRASPTFWNTSVLSAVIRATGTC